MKKKGVLLLTAITLLCGLLFFFAYTVHHFIANPPTQRPASPSTLSPDAVVATINGEPLYERELSAGLPRDSFDMTIANIRKAKLDRLINTRILKQFLKTQGIQAPAEKVDARIAELRKNPPAAGCICCRYNSLEEYLAASYMDIAELRDALSNAEAIGTYMMTRWNAEFPPGEKRDRLLEAEKPRIMSRYMRVSHIMFRTTAAKTSFFGPPDPKKAEAAALSVWERLLKGESFDTLAKECSEDDMSRPAAGALGFVPVDSFGKSFASAAMALAPGQYSKPVQSQWGFHIIRRETATDEDVAEVLKNEYVEKEIQKTVDEILKKAPVKINT